jgi:anti-sigma B factor antagonist
VTQNEVRAMTSPPYLHVDIGEDDGQVRVILSGELDQAAAPSLRERLADMTATQAGDVVLSIGLLTFIDSTGLSVFAMLHNELARQGRRLVIAGPTAMTRRLFQITGLDDVFNIEAII